MIGFAGQCLMPGVTTGRAAYARRMARKRQCRATFGARTTDELQLGYFCLGHLALEVACAAGWPFERNAQPANNTRGEGKLSQPSYLAV
jgi:hypothetical protein